MYFFYMCSTLEFNIEFESLFKEMIPKQIIIIVGLQKDAKNMKNIVKMEQFVIDCTIQYMAT